MNIKHLASAILMLLVSTTAFAGGENGFYLGGSVGQASVDYSNDNIKFDDDDSSYKIFGGYNFGIIPLIDIAAEAAYMDFGTQKSEDARLSTTAIGGFGLVGVNLGPIGLFGKVGAVNWDTEVNNNKDSGTDPAYGIGARFQLFSVSLRAEYEQVTAGDVDIDYFSVGASYTF